MNGYEKIRQRLCKEMLVHNLMRLFLVLALICCVKPMDEEGKSKVRNGFGEILPVLRIVN